jgi:hypothetical protein
VLKSTINCRDRGKEKCFDTLDEFFCCWGEMERNKQANIPTWQQEADELVFDKSIKEQISIPVSFSLGLCQNLMVKNCFC